MLIFELAFILFSSDRFRLGREEGSLLFDDLIVFIVANPGIFVGDFPNPIL